MDGDVWTVMLDFEDSRHVQREVAREILCFYTLVGLIEEFGYTALDYMYNKVEGGGLAPLQDDSDVSRMLELHKTEKKIWVFVTRKMANGAMPVSYMRQLIPLCPQPISLSYSSPRDEVDKSDKEDLGRDDVMESEEDMDSEGYFSDTPDATLVAAQKEKLLEIMRERKRERTDPETHCEGDTDEEDLYLVDIHEGIQLNRNVVEGAVPIEITEAGRNAIDISKQKGKYVETDSGSTMPSHLNDDDDSLLCSEDDDGAVVELVKRKRKRPTRLRGLRIMFNESNILDPTQLCKGMCFSDCKQYRRALKAYHVINGRDYRYVRNAPDRIIVKCKDTRCPFYMYASEIANEKTIMIRKIEVPHTCGVTMESSRVSSKFISEVFEEQIRSDPDWKITALMDEAQRKFGVEISKVMAYRARALAAEKVLGNHKEQYVRIRDYCETVRVKNPGSHVIVRTVPRPTEGLNPLFCGLFMCLNAQKEGFLAGCRPFIGVDGCFVKLTNGAQVLAATGRDGNNNLYPLAFGVVGKEDGPNWIWFLEMLKMAIGDGHEYSGWTIMSDRQKGLQKAVKKVFPNCENRYCKRHLYQNFCTAGYRGQNLKEHFDAAVYAYTEFEWKAAMDRMKAANEGAYNWLMKIPKNHWSRHSFKTHSKTDLVVNNLSEVFNNYIIECRDKPVQTMMESIRTKLMARYNDKREGGEAAQWDITPVMAEKLELEKRDARYCRPVCAGRDIWQVSCSDKTYEVNISTWVCDCFRWQLIGIPCKHACSAIFKAKRRPEEYVHECYRKHTYLRAYEQLIYPVPSKDGWVQTNTVDIDPPKFTRQPGRPKKSRRRGIDELHVASGPARMETVTCGNCNSTGHNYRTCGKELRPDLEFRSRAHEAARNSKQQTFYQEASSQPIEASRRVPRNYSGENPGTSTAHPACFRGDGRSGTGRGKRLAFLLFGERGV